MIMGISHQTTEVLSARLKLEKLVKNGQVKLLIVIQEPLKIIRTKASEIIITVETLMGNHKEHGATLLTTVSDGNIALVKVPVSMDYNVYTLWILFPLYRNIFAQMSFLMIIVIYLSYGQPIDFKFHQ